MKKQITTLTLLLSLVFLATCKKKENNDDDTTLFTLLYLQNQRISSLCKINGGTVSIPYITATSTSQELSFFANSDGTTTGIVIASGLTVGKKIVFTGNATAIAYVNLDSSGCSFSTSSTAGSAVTQTSTNPPSFTVASSSYTDAAILVTGNGSAVSVILQ
ncbi:MAG: hypothetical protein GW938_03960 [Leptospira sp.]|nr:hypothetical protein [Leptospira sp.]